MCLISARDILSSNRTKDVWKTLVEDTFDHLLGIKSDFKIGPLEIGPGHCGVIIFHYHKKEKKSSKKLFSSPRLTMSRKLSKKMIMGRFQAR